MLFASNNTADAKCKAKNINFSVQAGEPINILLVASVLRGTLIKCLIQPHQLTADDPVRRPTANEAESSSTLSASNIRKVLITSASTLFKLPW